MYIKNLKHVLYCLHVNNISKLFPNSTFRVLSSNLFISWDLGKNVVPASPGFEFLSKDLPLQNMELARTQLEHK